MGDGGAIRRPDATRDSALNNPIRGAKSARWASLGAFFRGRHESTEIAAFEGQPLAERAARNKWREGIEEKQDKKRSKEKTATAGRTQRGQSRRTIASSLTGKKIKIKGKGGR